MDYANWILLAAFLGVIVWIIDWVWHSETPDVEWPPRPPKGGKK